MLERSSASAPALVIRCIRPLGRNLKVMNWPATGAITGFCEEHSSDLRINGTRSCLLQVHLAAFSSRNAILLCHHGHTIDTDILNAAETGPDMYSDAPIVDSVIRSRKAVRVFRPDAVSRQDIADILDVARTAPSNSNTQPWHVHVLGGRVKRQLSDALADAHTAEAHPPLQHMPEPLPDKHRLRQEEFGVRYYGALGIDKADVAARSVATARNFDFFGAPVGLIFTIDRCLKKYSWLDYGMFLQTIMIAARARGLDTCAQVSIARFQDVIATHLDLEPGYDVVCGMSLGYAQEESIVNRLAMPRAPVDQFARFAGFDE